MLLSFGNQFFEVWAHVKNVRLLDARSFNAVYVTQSGESNADGRDDFLG